MGERNVPYNNQLTGLGANQQSEEPDHVLYGSYTASSHPNNVHTTIVPPPENAGNFYVHHLSYHPEGAIIYGMPPPNGVQPWHPAANAAASATSSNQANYVGQPYQFPGNPTLYLPFNNETQTWAWNQSVPLPYPPGFAGGYVPADAGNMGMQGFPVTSSNGGLNNFIQPAIPQGPPLHYHPLPPNLQYTGGHSPQMSAASPHRHLPSSSSNNTNNHRRRGFMRGSNTRHQNLPNMRGFPGNGGPMLNAAVDQHRDMRMDIDHMSYEELLALGEQIGNVAIGLSEEDIVTNLKTRKFLSSKTPSVLESVECQDQKTDLCVICQSEYSDEEMIGIIACGHEYHKECIKSWLVLKNECPICKSGALSPEKKGV